MTNSIPSRSEIVSVIQEILSDIIEDPDLELTEESDAEEVPDWDSVNHVKLIIGLEGNYGIRFNPDEINSLKKIGDLVDLIDRELRKL